MSIFYSRDGQNVKLEKKDFPQESDLQEYLKGNPEVIPITEINEDVEFDVIVREFPTSSGPIDIIGFDSEGNIYIIETKLYKNPDKRKVVAQILDYGAALSNDFNNGKEFLDELEQFYNEHNEDDLNSKLQILSESDNHEEIQNRIQYNFESTNINYIVLMDKLDQRLKNLIRYLNESSQFSIFAVELELYEHETDKIIIPHIFGVETKKKVTTGTRTYVYWDEEKFFQELGNNVSKDHYDAVRKLYDYLVESTYTINWGGGKSGTFNPYNESIAQGGIIGVYVSGILDIRHGWFGATEKTRNWRDEFLNKLKESSPKIGKELEQTTTKMHLHIPPETWTPEVDKIIEVLKSLI